MISSDGVGIHLKQPLVFIKKVPSGAVRQASSGFASWIFGVPTNTIVSSWNGTGS